MRKYLIFAIGSVVYAIVWASGKFVYYFFQSLGLLVSKYYSFQSAKTSGSHTLRWLFC